MLSAKERFAQFSIWYVCSTPPPWVNSVELTMNADNPRFFWIDLIANAKQLSFKSLYFMI